MAAPIADKIILPLDTGNTGKKVRSQTRVVGADTVHEHFFIPISSRSRLGVHLACSGTLSVQAAATNGTTTGFFWLANPVGSAVKIALRRMEFESNITTATAMLTLPRIAVARVTFTGANTGTLITPLRRDSTDPANVGEVRTTSATWAVTLGAIGYTFYPVIGQGVGTSGVTTCMLEWEPNEDGQPVLRAGEGLVLYQPDAGTASDSRRFNINLAWEEFE